jgi:hypothetical protein
MTRPDTAPPSGWTALLVDADELRRLRAVEEAARALIAALDARREVCVRPSRQWSEALQREDAAEERLREAL